MKKPQLSYIELKSLKDNNEKRYTINLVNYFFKQYSLDMFNSYEEFINYFFQYIDLNNIPLGTNIYDIYGELFNNEDFKNLCAYITENNFDNELANKIYYVYDLYAEKQKQSIVEAKKAEEIIDNDEPIDYDYNIDDADLTNTEDGEFEIDEEPEQEVEYDDPDNNTNDDYINGYHLGFKDHNEKNEEYVMYVQQYKKIVDELTNKNDLLIIKNNISLLDDMLSYFKAHYNNYTTLFENSAIYLNITNLKNAIINNDETYINANFVALKTKILERNFRGWVNYISSFNKSYLTLEEQKELAQAKEKLNYYESYLIEHNMKLIWSTSRKYEAYIEKDDVEVAAISGFRNAMYHYNPEKGVKFSTFAVKAIMRRTVREIDDTETTIRIPVHAATIKHQIKLFIVNYLKKHEKEPTKEEICAAFNLDSTYYDDIMRTGSELVSLDKKISDDSDSVSIGDMVPDYNTNVEDQVIRKVHTYQGLYDKLDCLTDREREVIIERFGLKDGRAKTLEEVGKMQNVTRERIRQIEAKALRKIRGRYRDDKRREARCDISESKNEKVNVMKYDTLTKPKTGEELRNS